MALVPGTEELELKTETGSLFGGLEWPDRPPPWPVVIIHAGSGPTDRDGNQVGMKNDSLKQLGQGLVEKGYAVLRVDKRGVGASRKALTKEADLRFADYSDDLTGWVKRLRADRRFSTVILAGHSEGSTIAMLAAQTEPVDALISLCGPGRKLSDILREQIAKNAPDQADASNAIISKLEQGVLVPEPPKALAALFRPSVQPYLVSQFRYDPTELLARLKCPVMIVSGTTDLQVPPTDAKLLWKKQPAAKLVELKNMSHVLKETELTAPLLQQLAVYNNVKAPLHPRLVSEIDEFLIVRLKLK